MLRYDVLVTKLDYEPQERRRGRPSPMGPLLMLTASVLLLLVAVFLNAMSIMVLGAASFLGTLLYLVMPPFR